MTTPAEHIKQLAAQVDEALPSTLDAVRTLAAEVDERAKDLRAALRAIPDAAEYAHVRARIAYPVAHVALLRAVVSGQPTARLTELLKQFDKARRAASRAERKAG